MGLSGKNCTPCKGGIPPLGDIEARNLLRDVPGWELVQGDTALHRAFSFSNFVDALAFVNRVGELAEAEGHHPDIAFGWGYVDINLYTHKINGLHENDFIMAAKIDAL